MMDQAALANVPDHCKAGLIAMNADQPLVQPGVLQNVLERLYSEEPVTSIAKSLGVQPVSLYAFLLRQAPEQWKAIQAGKALKKLDDSDKELDSCSNGVELGRARERIGLAKWTAERTSKAIYGNELALNVTHHSISIEDALAQAEQRLSGRIIDAEQQSQCSMDESAEKAE